MGKKKSGAKTLTKTLKTSAKVLQPKAQEKEKMNRIHKQMETELSPKYTEMKTGGQTSRFGRPQRAAKQEINSIPTEVMKFIPKHSPKRLKPKLDLDSSLTEEKPGNQTSEAEIGSENQDIPSHNKENLDEVECKVTEAAEVSHAEPDVSLEEPIEQEKHEDIVEPEASVEEPIVEAPIEQEKPVETVETPIVPEKQEKIVEAKAPLTLAEIFDEEVEEDVDETLPINDETGPINEDQQKSDEKEDLINEDNHEAMENHSDSVSDTDSALGSAASCSDTKDEEVTLGQVLWGTFNRQSWWPCIVYPIDETGAFLTEIGQSKKVHVKYFNWNTKKNKALLHMKNVFEFKNLDKFDDQLAERGIKRPKKGKKGFSRSCLKAIEEATFFSAQPISRRLEMYDEYVKKQKTFRRSMPSARPQNDSRSASERKSVDSALEASVSPAPSSPFNDNALDPLENLFKSMSKYDEMPPERKRTKIDTPKAVVKPAEPVESPVDLNRRKSGRAIKKRTYEDFQQDFEVNIKSAGASPVVEQKAKKPKLEKEETLEERFVVSQQDMRAIFRNMSKKKACIECLEVNDEPTYRCNGKGDVACSGWFHKDCSGEFEIVYEQVRHQTGDSDEIIQVPTARSTMVCKACSAGETKCFICKHPMGEESAAETSCPHSDCRMMFHKRCLSVWPQAKAVNVNRKSTQCPQHTCHTCFSKDIHNTGSLIKCVKCPSAYHLQPSCIPAGSQILTQFQLICPRHPTEKELLRNKKEMKPLNIDWCQICPNSGSLVCCESCPAAFHPDCINYKESDDVFNCLECQEGRLPLYNMIVWARVGAYRWWPGLIMPNNVLPETIAHSQKFPREFCVRFFGSYDFYWFTCERVFPYDGMNLSVKGGNSRLDYAFNTALNEAHEMSKILNLEDLQVINAKPKPYVKITMNRPVAPVKLKKVGEFTQEPCSCKETDADPCGRASDCINMHLNVECSKGLCPAGDRCQNQKLRNRDHVDIKIIKTVHRGFGAVCTKDVPEDTLVTEYVGELIDSTEFTKRMNAKIHNKEKDFYFLTVEGDLYVDAGPAGNLSRFINHSCEPNCITRKIQVEGNTRIGIYTKQAIKAGTELTFDYQMEFVDNKKTACYCGSSKCTGLIGEKPKEPEKKVTVKAKKRRRKPSVKQEVKAEAKTKTISAVHEAQEVSSQDVKTELPDETLEGDETIECKPDLTEELASPEKVREVDETTDPILITLEKMEKKAAGDSSHSEDELGAAEGIVKTEIDDNEPAMISTTEAVTDSILAPKTEDINEKPSDESKEPVELKTVNEDVQMTPINEQTAVVDTPPMSPTAAISE